MIFKIALLLSSCVVFVAHGSVGTTPASISQARSKAYQLASQLEQLIKDDVVGNESEISKLEKELQSYISSFKQVGQNKIAGEISLRSAGLQERKIQADIKDVADQASQIKKDSSDDAVKGKLALLENKAKDLAKNLAMQTDALKNALDENAQLQTKIDAAQQLQEGSGKEINRLNAELVQLKEELKKAPAATGGAAASTDAYELQEAREQIKKLKENQLKNSTGNSDLQAEIDQLRQQIQDVKNNLDEARKNNAIFKKVVDEKNKKIIDLTFKIASENDQARKEMLTGEIRELLNK